jgi:ATP phosphoribosyltransferase
MKTNTGTKDFKLKLGLPKGSLQEATVRMFKKAGFVITVNSRSYFPSIDDKEIEPVLLRAQEMSRYVEEGVLDCGITGNDWVLENKSDVIRAAELVYSKQKMLPVRWVLAVPQDSNYKSVKDLNQKRIATELVFVTREYLKKNRVDAEVEFSWGATEAKVAAGLVDGIVELTETGSSLRANKLKIIDTICLSTTQFIANKSSWKDPAKRSKMENIVLLLQGAILSEGKVGIKMNIRNDPAQIKKVLKLLPALKNPTISQLSDKKWVAVESIIDELVVRDLIPCLKKAGAQGIIEYPLNKVIY